MGETPSFSFNAWECLRIFIIRNFSGWPSQVFWLLWGIGKYADRTARVASSKLNITEKQYLGSRVDYIGLTLKTSVAKDQEEKGTFAHIMNETVKQRIYSALILDNLYIYSFHKSCSSETVLNRILIYYIVHHISAAPHISFPSSFKSIFTLFQV